MMVTFKNGLAAAALALTLPLATMSTSHAAPLVAATSAPTMSGTQNNITEVRYWGHRGGGWGWGGVGAGLAAGAIIGGAIAASQAPYGYPPGYYAPGYAPGVVVDDDSVAYCSQRYKSYDPGSGTFLGYDGLRHPCP